MVWRLFRRGVAKSFHRLIITILVYYSCPWCIKGADPSLVLGGHLGYLCLSHDKNGLRQLATPLPTPKYNLSPLWGKKRPTVNTFFHSRASLRRAEIWYAGATKLWHRKMYHYQLSPFHMPIYANYLVVSPVVEWKAFIQLWLTIK